MGSRTPNWKRGERKCTSWENFLYNKQIQDAKYGYKLNDLPQGHVHPQIPHELLQGLQEQCLINKYVCLLCNVIALLKISM